MIPLRVLILTVCLSLLPTLLFAHGGEQHDDHEATIEEQPAVGSPVKLMEDLPMESGTASNEPVDYGTAPTTHTMEHSDAPSLGLGDDPLGLGSDSMNEAMPSMDHSGHDMAGMKKEEQHVEQATHEMVSGSSKGYGIAVGITVLSGLVAGFLFLKRPTDS